MRRNLPWLATALLLAACASPRPAAPPAPGPADALFTCQADADCSVEEMGCCDHCNGGWLLSVKRARVDAARARYPAPLCRAGTCARSERRVDEAGRERTIVIDNQIPRPAAP